MRKTWKTFSAKDKKIYTNVLNSIYGDSPYIPQEIGKPRVRKRTKFVRKEYFEQVDTYLWTQTQDILRGYVMKIGNEGKRTIAQGAMQKQLGLLRGASDLFIARPFGKYHGMWIEMKQDREYTASERAKDSWIAQEEFQSRMRSVGYYACFAFGVRDAIDLIIEYIRNI